MSTTINRTTEIVLTTLGILVLTWVGLMAVMMIAMALMGGVSGMMMPMMDHGIHSGGVTAATTPEWRDGFDWVYSPLLVS